jgi:hypothetical protein
MNERLNSDRPVAPRPLKIEMKTLLTWAIVFAMLGILGAIFFLLSSFSRAQALSSSTRDPLISYTHSIVAADNLKPVLPQKRIIAYYGNLYSKRMGILGELPPDQMTQKLEEECKKWKEADPATEVQPALHYIAVTAQGEPGKDGKYRLRMPDSQIDKVIEMAKSINAIVFLDVQVALSTLEAEIPRLEKYLKMPNVHLGIDPEFSMKNGDAPGKSIGTFDAKDVNYTIQYLDKLSRNNNIPSKVLVVHRFTQRMVTNAKLIKPTNNVQVVMHMDGWGEPAKKVNTYKQFIVTEPVQYTGFKIFYKNDTKKVNRAREMQPSEVLKLNPKPLYIQYQ